MTSPTPRIRSAIATGVAVFATGIVLVTTWWRRDLEQRKAILNETLPVHSAWWRDNAKQPGELLYVAIGDSAAQGIGASSPNKSYVGVLADHVRLATGRTVRVVNLSVSGATVALAVRDQLPRFDKLEPDLVTVAIGANDIAQWNPDAFETGIRSVFDALPPHALVADLPCFHLPHNEIKVAMANEIIRRIAADRTLTVVPLHATTKRAGFRSILTHVAKDRFHPNDRGYRSWAEAFLPAMSADVAHRFAAVNHTPTEAD
ncbi:SGNH/GDSL hydrolase family protein [Cryobacterium suzukii]|uniref:SGNH/GDSL hydrolase family protein n=1 Tax=Cryobacterium suzukii TaxID=1259198 RepID=A0A4R9AC08_9MICO|nr:SGNH/GDSL hydrolase family protein [Cryobacterium suzukii]TFD56765.1 SGNH/GDSL hydrolase family protein [Cryobacterium suzukii]